MTVPTVAGVEWSEIVTTALLGTGRRPPPEEQPPWAPPAGAAADRSPEGRVLDLAAAHRVAAQAGRRPELGQPTFDVTAVPAQTLPFAPVAARQLLEAFLGRPDVGAINVWLAACARHGRGAAPEHWARLAGLGARSTAYDRRLLADVLGERGRWFTRQNPEWAKLAAALDLAEPAGEPPAVVRVPADPDALAKDPQLLLSVPDPWPDRLLVGALAGLVAGRMGSTARPYARSVGARLGPTQYAELGRLATRFLELPQLNPAQRRAVRGLFVEIERAGFDRIEIDRAFDPDAVRVFKITIPNV